jgi:hypothetical protein
MRFLLQPLFGVLPGHVRTMSDYNRDLQVPEVCLIFYLFQDLYTFSVFTSITEAITLHMSAHNMALQGMCNSQRHFTKLRHL